MNLYPRHWIFYVLSKPKVTISKNDEVFIPSPCMNIKRSTTLICINSKHSLVKVSLVTLPFIQDSQLKLLWNQSVYCPRHTVFGSYLD